jgi:hypothetical protein
MCDLYNRRNRSIRVSGVLTKDGRFYARAALFVAPILNGDWKKVTGTLPSGTQTSRTIGAISRGAPIYLDADPLIPLISADGYVKAVLSSGDTTFFAIKALSP